jgi:hypothetical protein
VRTPIDDINDGHQFQRIVAEYFRCLKNESHGFKISDIEVEDNGEGADGGCDILVVFHFEDAIRRHTHRWVIECKCHNKAVGIGSVDTGNIVGVLKQHKAKGYLLVCKKDASSQLKKRFQEMSANDDCDYVVWNGVQLWHKFVERKNLLEAFFPEYHYKKFLETNDQEAFERLVVEFETKTTES